MDLITGIIGFAVLTGPLWLILLILPISLLIAVAISKLFRPGGVRIIAGVLAFMVFFMLPFLDEIAGRIYLDHLCKTKASVTVYQTVELSDEYWDEAGSAIFYRNFDVILGDEYSIKYKGGAYSSLFNIENAGYAYLNKKTGEIIGEANDFRYWGGWIKRSFSPNKSAESCIDYSDQSNRLIDLIFIPKNKGNK